MRFEELIFPFISGGLIVAGVKYTAEALGNAKLAAVIGGFPIGLFSIYYLSDKAAYQYGWNYGLITSVLLSSVVVFNLMYKYFKLSKNISHIISLVFWFVFAFIRVYF